MSYVQIWCDHCHQQFAAELERDAGTTTAMCPHCRHQTTVVWCPTCEQRSEIATRRFEQETWICPTCKEHFPFPAAHSNHPLLDAIHIDQPAQSRPRGGLPFSFRTVIIVGLFSWFAWITLSDAIPSQTSQYIPFATVRDEQGHSTAQLPPQSIQVIAQPTYDLSALGVIAYAQTVPRVDPETLKANFPYRLYLVDLTTLHQGRLPIIDEDVASEQPLFWNQDGQIVYARIGDGQRRLMLVSRRQIGSADYPLKGLPSKWDEIAFSPRRSRVAFTSTDANWASHLTVMQILNDQADTIFTIQREIDSFSWSPDGERIVFSADNSLYILSVVDYGRADRIVDGTAQNRNPSWSPDGTTIAFVSDRDGQPDLYHYEIATKTVTRRTTLGDVLSAAWSPGGQYIAFSSDVDGDYDLYIVPAWGGEAVKLFDTNQNERYPVWGMP